MYGEIKGYKSPIRIRIVKLNIEETSAYWSGKLNINIVISMIFLSINLNEGSWHFSGLLTKSIISYFVKQRNEEMNYKAGPQ